MLTGTQENQGLPLSVTLPFFLLSSVSLFIISILLFLTTDTFYSHYFQPLLLCITHLAVLGFITSFIFGSTYQIHRTILGVNIYSQNLAKLTYISLALGILLLCYSFYKFSLGLICQSGALLVLVSFILFAVNFFLATRQSEADSLETDILSSSVIWLLVTGIVGVLLVYNLTNGFIPKSHLEILTIHAHLGFAGWILLFAIGISSKVISAISTIKKPKKQTLQISYILINAGLILLSVSIYWELNSVFRIISSFLLSIGILFFLYFFTKAFLINPKATFNFDIKITAISLFILLTTLPIGILLSFEVLDSKQTVSIVFIYGVLFIMGFCGTTILGHALKIIDLMYNKNKTIHTPHATIINKSSHWMTILFIAGIAILSISYSTKFNIGVQISSILLMVASILYNYSLIRVMLNKNDF